MSHTQTHTDLDSQTSRCELLIVAFIKAVLSHQGRKMLQTVSVTLRGRDVQQVVPILISDQLEVICCQVRLWEQEERGRGRRRRGGREAVQPKGEERNR